jgi:predicted membrane protein
MPLKRGRLFKRPRWARPSTLLRLAWLLVAGLHVWLVARRLATVELATAGDMARAVLCLAGVAYASLKLWSVSTVFDARPRRAVAFFLILALGHMALTGPATRARMADKAPAAMQVMLVASVAAVVVLATRRASERAARRAIPSRRATALARARSRWILHRPRYYLDFSPHLFRRPPPALA